jgi:hypothetical protein
VRSVGRLGVGGGIGWCPYETRRRGKATPRGRRSPVFFRYLSQFCFCPLPAIRYRSSDGRWWDRSCKACVQQLRNSYFIDWKCTIPPPRTVPSLTPLDPSLLFRVRHSLPLPKQYSLNNRSCVSNSVTLQFPSLEEYMTLRFDCIQVVSFKGEFRKVTQGNRNRSVATTRTFSFQFHHCTHHNL